LIICIKISHPKKRGLKKTTSRTRLAACFFLQMPG
jgi:hypothetical protein